MDRRVALLREFYRGMPLDRAKVETARYGFAFLSELLTGTTQLEYGELTAFESLHKYKLTHVTEERLNELLRDHVEKRCNVCLYFDSERNKTFCINLDNNHKVNNTVIIEETQIAVEELGSRLATLGCEPLIVASGRGYHVWGRLDSAIDNVELHRFMLHVSSRVLLTLHQRGLDPRKLKLNFYPDPRIHDVVSLRLFGSEHAKNKVFSRILANGALLDEDDSWAHFEAYLRGKTISLRAFEAAAAAVALTTP